MTTVELLVRVHESLSRSKGGPAPLVSHHLARFCSDHLPDGVTRSMFRRANANAAVVVSNVRAHDRKLHISGMTLESAAGFLPLPPGIPIGVVVQSYAGVVSLTVNAERWAVPDADKFLGWVLDEYGRLYEEASKLDNKKRAVALIARSMPLLIFCITLIIATPSPFFTSLAPRI